MLGPLLYFVGAILILLGVLNVTGIFLIGSLSGVAYIVLGFLFVLAAYFLSGAGPYTRAGRRGL